MTSMPWVKIYTEILDDIKIARLTDAQRWRFVELILLAAECDAEGALVTGDSPMTPQDIAWRLRCDVTTLSKDIEKIGEIGLIHMEHGAFIVSKFVERQGPTQANKRKVWRERQKEHRERVKLANVTLESRMTGTNVTGVDKIRVDKIREEEEGEKIPPAAAIFSPTLDQQASRMLSEVTGWVSFPADEQGRFEQFVSMIQQYGYDPCKQALITEFDIWKKTPRKNGGGTYNSLRMVWADRAMNALAGNAVKVEKPMTPDEERAHWEAIAAAQEKEWEPET